MDEIEYKLKSNNPAIVNEALDRVVKALHEKRGLSDFKDLRELKLLKEKCTSESHVVSLSACKSIVSLVENDVMQLGSAMSLLMSLLPNVQTCNGLISSITDLLCLDLDSKNTHENPYTCSFTLKDPQHPLITILEKNPNSISNVLSQMSLICRDERTKVHSLEMLRPVFLWILCLSDNPNVLHHSIDAIHLLLEHESNFSVNSLLREFVCWQQFSDEAAYPKVFSVYKHLTQWFFRYDKSQLPALFPILARISTIQLLRGYDPRCFYSLIQQCCDQTDYEMGISADWTLTLLASNVVGTSPAYLSSLLTLCKNIIIKLVCSIFSLNILKASLLQWLCYGTSLTLSAMEMASEIIFQIENTKELKESVIPEVSSASPVLFQYFDERTNFTFELYKTWYSVGLDADKLALWLKSIALANMELKKELFLPLLGLLLVDTDHNIAPKVLKILLDVIREDVEQATILLPVLLNYLSKARHPPLILESLKAIVETCVCKVNTPLVIFTLTTLYKNRGIELPLMIYLLTNLEGLQPRTYTYLQEYLLEKCNEGTPELIWEVEIAKAAAIKSVSEKRAIQHGPEFVSILSQILNRCSNENGDVASGLVLDALGILWKEHVVSPVSTWSALAPKLAKDNRPLVQVSLCKLLGNVPALHTNTPEYNNFIFEALTTLWRLTAESDNASVINAAFGALSLYSLEDMHLKQLPTLYKRDINIKSTNDPDVRPEDYLDYIPAEIWPTIFRYMNHSGLKGLTTLCTSLIRQEINGYRGGVYQTEREDGEPITVKNVRRDSVVKGLVEFLKSETLSPSHHYEAIVLLAMMNCLIEVYAKPLPPFNWIFLQQLFHQDTAFRTPCILLAAKQAVISGTAKRFVENYLSEFKPSDSEVFMILDLFESLPLLAQTISPQYIGSLVELCIKYAYIDYSEQLELNKNLDVEELLLTKLLRFLKSAFASNKMSQVNCSVITALVEDFYRTIHHNDLVWYAFGDLCTQLSAENVNALTSSSNWFDLSKELLRKSTYIRCKLAMDQDLNNPLYWLTEVIDNVIELPTEHMTTLHQICPALLKVQSDSVSTLQWLLQLISRTQEIIAKKPSNEHSISFLCDTFMMCVLLLSTRHLLCDINVELLCVKKEQRFCLFPNSVPLLINANRPKEWQSAGAQIIEWLHYTRNQLSVPLIYRQVFYNALLACRNCAYSKNASVKAKMLSVRNI